MDIGHRKIPLPLAPSLRHRMSPDREEGFRHGRAAGREEPRRTQRKWYMRVVCESRHCEANREQRNDTKSYNLSFRALRRHHQTGPSFARPFARIVLRLWTKIDVVGATSEWRCLRFASAQAVVPSHLRCLIHHAFARLLSR